MALNSASANEQSADKEREQANRLNMLRTLAQQEQQQAAAQEQSQQVGAAASTVNTAKAAIGAAKSVKNLSVAWEKGVVVTSLAVSLAWLIVPVPLAIAYDIHLLRQAKKDIDALKK